MRDTITLTNSELMELTRRANIEAMEQMIGYQPNNGRCHSDRENSLSYSYICKVKLPGGIGAVYWLCARI